VRQLDLRELSDCSGGALLGAAGEDISASIAFTAVLGVIVVLGRPVVPALLHIDGRRYGVLAGLTVMLSRKCLHQSRRRVQWPSRWVHWSSWCAC
jgi:hypothetical protein